MKTRILSTALLIVLLNLAFTSCKKKTTQKPEPDPISQPPVVTRNVRYEITGNYGGPLFVVYNDNVSGNTALTVSALPWRKDVTYSANVQGIGISSNSASGQQGAPGQTASLKIYVGNNVVQSSGGVADANGTINLPPLAYVFP
jgi:hypothetical protein